MVILYSKDLVNWSIVGHAVEDISRIGPELNWDRMDRYGRGIWAGAIRYHEKKFWIYFGTPNEGFFVTTATSPAWPWEPLWQLCTDGMLFAQFGNAWHLTWGNYRDDRVGIFTFNNKSDSGYIDVDFFHYDYARPGEK